MALTRLQIHNRRRALQGHERTGRLRRFGALNRRVIEAQAEAAHARHELNERKKYTVCLGMEQGFRDPTYALTVSVHPQEFKYALLREQARGPQMENISYRAHMIGREVAEKVARVLTDHCEGSGQPARSMSR